MTSTTYKPQWFLSDASFVSSANATVLKTYLDASIARGRQLAADRAQRETQTHLSNGDAESWPLIPLGCRTLLEPYARAPGWNSWGAEGLGPSPRADPWCVPYTSISLSRKAMAAAPSMRPVTLPPSAPSSPRVGPLPYDIHGRLGQDPHALAVNDDMRSTTGNTTFTYGRGISLIDESDIVLSSLGRRDIRGRRASCRKSPGAVGDGRVQTYISLSFLDDEDEEAYAMIPPGLDTDFCDRDEEQDMEPEHNPAGLGLLVNAVETSFTALAQSDTSSETSEWSGSECGTMSEIRGVPTCMDDFGPRDLAAVAQMQSVKALGDYEEKISEENLHALLSLDLPPLGFLDNGELSDSTGSSSDEDLVLYGDPDDYVHWMPC